MGLYVGREPRVARMMCAVLDRNEVGWKLRLYERLGLPKLSKENYDRLMRLENSALSQFT